jgi:DNA-binding protein HU-beta
MAKGNSKSLTKSQIAAALAEQVGISKKQVAAFFDAQATLAYKNARNAFVIPGIGKVVITESAAREMVMQFGDRKGETIKIPRKRKLKFRFSKVAKDAILGAK